jgi:folate-binding protein YgfZ
MTKLAHLTSRAVIGVAGTDRVSFLNGLVSNDVAQARPGAAVWAALLTPQGKYLADFFIFDAGDVLLLDCEAASADDLLRRLSRYRLRAAVTLAARDCNVYAAWDGPPPPAGLSASDPRLAEAGSRLISATALPTNASAEEYDLHRLALGLPDGVRDLEPDKTILLEAGFDELHGVSWTKGCYMGQELTARTRYRGLVKRRLVPVHAAQDLPPAGTPVQAGAREAGQMRSSRGTLGLATLRLDAIGAGDLTAGETNLHTFVPQWMRLPEIV